LGHPDRNRISRKKEKNRSFLTYNFCGWRAVRAYFVSRLSERVFSYRGVEAVGKFAFSGLGKNLTDSMKAVGAFLCYFLYYAPILGMLAIAGFKLYFFEKIKIQILW